MAARTQPHGAHLRSLTGLSLRTLRMRRRLKIAIGDAGNQAMLRAMRVHSNFAEYVPLSLLLLYFAETSGANPGFVHLLALCLLAGRLAHAFGVSQVDENYRFRVFGMTMTFATLVSAAGSPSTMVRISMALSGS